MKRVHQIYHDYVDRVRHYVRGYKDGVYNYYNETDGGMWYRLGNDAARGNQPPDIYRPISCVDRKTADQVVRIFEVCHPTWHQF